MVLWPFVLNLQSSGTTEKKRPRVHTSWLTVRTGERARPAAYASAVHGQRDVYRSALPAVAVSLPVQGRRGARSLGLAERRAVLPAVPGRAGCERAAGQPPAAVAVARAALAAVVLPQLGFHLLLGDLARVGRLWRARATRVNGRPLPALR